MEPCKKFFYKGTLPFVTQYKSLSPNLPTSLVLILYLSSIDTKEHYLLTIRRYCWVEDTVESKTKKDGPGHMAMQTRGGEARAVTLQWNNKSYYGDEHKVTKEPVILES